MKLNEMIVQVRENCFDLNIASLNPNIISAHGRIELLDRMRRLTDSVIDGIDQIVGEIKMENYDYVKEAVNELEEAAKELDAVVTSCIDKRTYSSQAKIDDAIARVWEAVNVLEKIKDSNNLDGDSHG